MFVSYVRRKWNFTFIIPLVFMQGSSKLMMRYFLFFKEQKRICFINWSVRFPPARVLVDIDMTLDSCPMTLSATSLDLHAYNTAAPNDYIPIGRCKELDNRRNKKQNPPVMKPFAYIHERLGFFFVVCLHISWHSIPTHVLAEKVIICRFFLFLFLLSLSLRWTAFH